jgi:hypothetical protein
VGGILKSKTDWVGQAMSFFNAAEHAACMVIGADLRVQETSHGWGQLGLRGAGRLKGKRIDELFPATDIRAEVLDVLASGQPLKNVLLPVEGASGTCYLTASLLPVESDGRKPRKILLQANELLGELLIDEDSGEILAMNNAAAEVLRGEPGEWMGRSVWKSGILNDAGKRRVSLAILERKRALHLGRVSLSANRGQQIELEGALVLAE